jgi:hypothetical protein
MPKCYNDKEGTNSQHIILTASSVLYKVKTTNRQEGAQEASMLSLAKNKQITPSGTLSLA